MFGDLAGWGGKCGVAFFERFSKESRKGVRITPMLRTNSTRRTLAVGGTMGVPRSKALRSGWWMCGRREGMGLRAGIFTMKSLKSMKDPLHAGIPLLRVLGAFVVKYKRRLRAGFGAGIFACCPLHALRGLHGESKRRQRAGSGAGIFTMKSMKGMKVPLHEGLPPLCVLGALVVKTRRRCGVDRGRKFYPKCDDPVPQCSVQRGGSRYEADRCGVQRGGSQCAAGRCGVQRVGSQCAAGRCGVQRVGSQCAAGRCSVQRGGSQCASSPCGVQRVGSQCEASRCSVQRRALTRTIHSFSTLSSSVTLVPPLCKMPLPEVENRGRNNNTQQH